MYRRITLAFLGLAPLLAACGGAAASMGQDTSPDGLLACELRTGTHNGTTTIEGIVHAAESVAGSYRLSVDSAGGSGGSRINQGGEFAAAPDAPATLGRVTLGGGGTFDARLEVDAAGSTVTCRAPVGGPV